MARTPASGAASDSQEARPFDDGRSLPGISEYIGLVLARKWSIIGVTLAILGVWALWSASRPPHYQATAEVLVMPVGIPGEDPKPGIATEQKIARSIGVAEVAAQKLGLDEPETLLRGLSVEVEGETPVLVFSYSSADPTQASRFVQAQAESYLEHRRQQVLDGLESAARGVDQKTRVLRQRLASVNTRLATAATEQARSVLLGEANSLTGQISVLEQELIVNAPGDNLRIGEILQPAAISSLPATRAREGGIVLALGLSLGLAQALVLEFVTGRVRSPEDLEAMLGAPVLGTIPGATFRERVRGRPATARLIVTSGDGADAADAFRRLRVAFLLAVESVGAKAILLAGTGGKTAAKSLRTRVTVNLSASLAGAGRRVALVITHPGGAIFEGALRAQGGAGLAEVITGDLSVEEALSATGVDNLYALPAGTPPEGRVSADLLGSQEMEKVLQELKGSADLILVDVRDIHEAPDAVTLAPIVDGTVLVVDARDARRANLERVRQQLNRVGAKVLGIITIGP